MTIKRALISVSNKAGIIDFCTFLRQHNVEILSTGGTAHALRQANIEVTEVSDHTGFPEMMDGRVKTLHPKIHGGLLALRDNDEHLQSMSQHNIDAIDLVVINLYPFEATVASGADAATCIENIDIGGPSMIRSAAKNHRFVTIIVDAVDYGVVMDEMKAQAGATTLATRQYLAAKAYSRTASYDAAISNWLNAQTNQVFPPLLTISGRLKDTLHYGENPHQLAAVYRNNSAEASVVNAKQVQGAGLSYNNYNDVSAAFELVREFEQPAVAIIKHANPCGVAVGGTIVEAFTNALACDPVSAYGGIIATNRPLDKAFCEAVGKLFLEVMIAPDADADALALLAAKKKLKLLLSGSISKPETPMMVKSISGGFLYQHDDGLVFKDPPKPVTKQAPSAQQMEDLLFAFTVAKHVKSNAIVLVRNGATIGIGAGQMSRIDSTRLACLKAKEAGLMVNGAVLASDAFFPFADNVELAAAEGIGAIIQPGGSIRDAEIIAAAEKAGIPMVFTGIRHFRH